jgi:penicillin-binding protein 1B
MSLNPDLDPIGGAAPVKQHPHPSKSRWMRIARVGTRSAARFFVHHRTAIALSVVVPLLVVSVAFGYVYHHYSALIDKQLAGGPFQDADNIYASPLVIATGDAVGVNDLESELTMAGYDSSGKTGPKTFKTSGNTIVVTSPDGDPVRIAIANDQVQRIAISGHDVKNWTAGSPLLTSLTAKREKRHMVTFNEIPKSLVNAVTSIEDKHFFKHRGLDVPRIAKAAYVDFRDGRKEQGASTLTMQLVRGLWLQPEKRWKRKIAEAIMTIHLERKWSKETIFETYANEVYLGREAAYSIHGFAEGSEAFFGKPLSDITLPQAALLAGMVQRPSYFNPFRNPDRAKERRDLVLLLMKENQYITPDQYSSAVDSPLGVIVQEKADDALGTSYFLDLVLDEIQSAPREEGSASDVNTTIDLNLQKAAHEAVDVGMAQVDKLLAAKYAKSGKRAEAALIALDPHTGEIKAVIGGRDYTHSQLNRILAKRPPGSVFKPFVYAAALNTAIEGGNQVFTPASTVNDSPTVFHVGKRTYEPSNFKNESFGTLTFRQALAKSDNIAAVKVAQLVGFDQVVAMARRAGLNDDIKPTPAVALGTYDVTPLEMAGAYTSFANGGMWVKPHILENESAESHQAMDPRLAYLMVNMLEEVMRTGTAASVRSRGFLLPAAGKTGTSHDGWFAGFTTQLLCIVWVGFDDYSELDLEGAKSALPIWTEFMKRASKFSQYRDAREFPSPGGIDSVKICNQSGKLAGDLCTSTRTEVFISGTQPQDVCNIHDAPAVVTTDDAASPSGMPVPVTNQSGSPASPPATAPPVTAPPVTAPPVTSSPVTSSASAIGPP